MELGLILQIAGVVLGLLYLYLEYKANVWLWIVGLLMPLVHSVLFFKSGLYADFGMEVYYVLAGIWGLFAWNSKKVERNIGHAPSRVWPVAAAAFALLWTGLYCLLRFCTDSTVPFFDSFTTALSMIAMWMLSRKYIEQWILWAVVDAVTVGLYMYKGIPLTACLYLLYTVLAFVGLRKWLRVYKGD